MKKLLPAVASGAAIALALSLVGVIASPPPVSLYPGQTLLSRTQAAYTVEGTQVDTNIKCAALYDESGTRINGDLVDAVVQDGIVRYYVVVLESFLGVGGQYLIVPASSVELSMSQRSAKVLMTTAKLRTTSLAHK